jgi:hypothetical protein
LSTDNILPFRKRPPSDKEMDVYREVTKRWTDASRQLLLPEHYSNEWVRRGKQDPTPA